MEDTITGFTGVVTARTQWLHNCNIYRVQPTQLKDGKIQEVAHFDEPQLRLVKEATKKEEENKTGGPEKVTAKTNEP